MPRLDEYFSRRMLAFCESVYVFPPRAGPRKTSETEQTLCIRARIFRGRKARSSLSRILTAVIFTPTVSDGPRRPDANETSGARTARTDETRSKLHDSPLRIAPAKSRLEYLLGAPPAASRHHLDALRYIASTTCRMTAVLNYEFGWAERAPAWRGQSALR